MTPYSLRFSFAENLAKLKAELGHPSAPKYPICSGIAINILGQFIGLYPLPTIPNEAATLIFHTEHSNRKLKGKT